MDPLRTKKSGKICPIKAESYYQLSPVEKRLLIKELGCNRLKL